MPKYQITAPTGETYEVNAPEGATQDQVMAYVQQQHEGLQQQSLNSQQAAVPTEQSPPQEPSLLHQIGNSFANAGANLVKGAGSLVDLPIDATNAAISHFGGPENYLQTVHGLVDRGTQAIGIQPDNSSAGQVAGAIERGLGGVAGGMGIGSALKQTQKASAKLIGDVLLSHPGAQVAAATAGSAAGDIARQSGASPLVQLAFSLGGGVIPSLLEGGSQGTLAAARRLLGSPDAETQALAQKATQAGIPLKASQVSDSKVAKLIDSATGQVPFSGASKFQGEQQAAFNRAIAQTIGEDVDKITPTVFARAKARIGSDFERLTSNNDLPLSPQLASDIRQIVADANDFRGFNAQAMVNGVLKRLTSQQQNGVVPGKAYQSLDSELGRASTGKGDAAYVAGRLQGALRDAMESNLSPEDAAAWQQARAQYRDLKTIEPLVAKSTNGDISPAQLIGRVLSNNAGKAAMARGSRGDLGDMARIGQRFIKDQIPDSGTARRVAVMNALKGVGSVGTAAAAGSVLGPLNTLSMLGTASLLSRGAQNILANPRLVQGLIGNAGSSKNALLSSFGASINPSQAAILSKSH